MLSCLSPIEAWQDLESFLPSGKHPVVFSRNELQQLVKVPLHRCYDENGSWINKRFRPLSIRCGKCILCKQARSHEIAVRALLEIKGYDALSGHSFVTLTVDDQHMPAIFPGGKLQHRPFQLFMKRLRKAGIECRYLMCGEYGERSRRPHYHVILFGWFPRDSWIDDQGCYHGSRLLERVWPYGHVRVDRVNDNRVFYVSGYTLKDDGDGQYASYVRWSRRPGLGSDYIERHGFSQLVINEPEWYKGKLFDNYSFRTFSGRRQMRFVSRFVDDKLSLISPEKFDIIKAAREDRALKEHQKLLDCPSLAILTARSLKNRAELLNYQLAKKSREFGRL